MPCEALRGSVSDDRAKDGCLYLLAILCTKIWATKLGGIIEAVATIHQHDNRIGCSPLSKAEEVVAA